LPFKENWQPPPNPITNSYVTKRAKSMIATIDNSSAAASDPQMEWEYPIMDKGNGSETELHLPKALENLLSAAKEEVAKTDTVACHTETPTLSPQHSVACHSEHIAIQGNSAITTESNLKIISDFVKRPRKAGS
jgi:hypothetical protein